MEFAEIGKHFYARKNGDQKIAVSLFIQFEAGKYFSRNGTSSTRKLRPRR